MDFGLTEEHSAIVAMARDFAAAELAPFAVEWDQDKHFPVETLRKAGATGMGGITVSDGCRRFRPWAAGFGADHRGAGDRLPVDRILYLDPQHGGIDDRPLRRPGAAPDLAADAGLDGAARQLLPDRAGFRIGRRGAQDARGSRRRRLRRDRPEAVHLRRRRGRCLRRHGAHRARMARKASPA